MMNVKMLKPDPSHCTQKEVTELLTSKALTFHESQARIRSVARAKRSEGLWAEFT